MLEIESLKVSRRAMLRAGIAAGCGAALRPLQAFFR